MLSKGSLLAKHLPKELEAALLGDFARLRVGSPDAQHFANAFGSEGGRAWWNEADPDGPLGWAAKAVSSERRGEGDAATSIYARLTKEKTSWPCLLGLLLEGWSGLVEDRSPIELAADQVQALRKSSRKARLLAKLSGFAADKGSLEFSRALWGEAIDASEESSQLGRALRIEGLNLGFDCDMKLLQEPQDEVEDDLVWPDQIPELRLRSATNAAVQAVEDRLGGPWRFTIRMGVTPINDLNSAEAQARWIGAPWLRRPILMQLGAQLLAGSAESSDQWAQGVLAWSLGGGSSQELALRYGEPHFNQDSADYILKSIGECDPTRGRFQRLASLGAETWDLISDQSLRWLAEEIAPLTGQGSPAEESRMIWAGLALRLTDEWFASYRKLDQDVQGALLDWLEPPALRHFNAEMKAAIYATLRDDQLLLAEGGRLLPFAAAIAPASDDERLRKLVESKPLLTRVITRLIEERPSVVSKATEKRVQRKLGDSILEQSDKARSGTISLGGPGPRLELGRMLAVSRSFDQDLVNLLIESATDPESPPQYVTEARQGLVLLRRVGRLRISDQKRLRDAPDPEGQGLSEEGLTKGVLRVLLLQILVEKLTAAERTELVAAVRSPEERVRDIAVNTCAEGLRSHRDEGLAWAVVSGLFDPSDSVSDGALAGLLPLTEDFPAAAEVAWQRLPILFDSSARQVRAQIVHSLEHVRPRTRQQEERHSALLSRARQDRSWLVRDAASSFAAE